MLQIVDFFSFSLKPVFTYSGTVREPCLQTQCLVSVPLFGRRAHMPSDRSLVGELVPSRSTPSARCRIRDGTGWHCARTFVADVCTVVAPNTQVQFNLKRPAYGDTISYSIRIDANRGVGRRHATGDASLASLHDCNWVSL